MNRLSCDCSLLLGKLFLLLVLPGTSEERCAAYELTLPEVGANVGYNFHLESPVLTIAEATPSAQAIQARVTFADGKHLRTAAEADNFSFGIDVELGAIGVVGLFEPTFNPFDETLSLLDKDGTPIATTENGGVLNDEDGDEYGFRWEFDFGSDVAFYGFEWTITPNLIEGASLPETLSLTSIVWAAGSILVVPEPAGAQFNCVMLLSLALFRQRPLVR